MGRPDLAAPQPQLGLTSELYSDMGRDGRRGGAGLPAWLSRQPARRLLCPLAATLLLVPALVLLWPGRSPAPSGLQPDTVDSADTARRVLGLLDWDRQAGPELRRRIEELLRIKDSVRAELGGLQRRRAALLAELAELGAKLEQGRAEVAREGRELARIRGSVEQQRLQQRELVQRNTPDIAAPLPLLASRAQGRTGPASPPSAAASCTTQTCLDLSRCSVTSRLPVYVYPGPSTLQSVLEPGLAQHITPAPATACLYLVLNPVNTSLAALQHWAGDGRNHLLLADGEVEGAGRALSATPAAVLGRHRPGYDLVVPPWSAPAAAAAPALPALVPVVREYLLAWEGEAAALGEQDRALVAALQDMKLKGTTDKLLLSFSCGAGGVAAGARPGEWAQCGERAGRLARLQRATFCLLLPPPDRALLSTSALQHRLLECLEAGSVPVLLSSDLLLPYSQLVDWGRVALSLPSPRVTELHFLLRSLPYPDIFAMKRQGRLVLTRYLASPAARAATLLAALSSRLSIPAPPAMDTPSPSVFNSSFTPLLMDQLPPDSEPGESLGPLEPPAASPAFRRNYSALLTGAGHAWNSVFSAVELAPPYTPWQPLLPTEAKWAGSGLGFRPIGAGEGGAGREFSGALGGNSPQEQVEPCSVSARSPMQRLCGSSLW